MLLLYGGWEGHQPAQFADFAEEKLLRDFAVTRAQSLEVLEATTLQGFDLLLPIWTFDELTPEQESALSAAVAAGLGFVGWHGQASAFLSSRPHKFVLGGQFVGHPGGNHLKYPVSFDRDDVLTKGLADLELVSEQYYLLVDPAVKVLASTNMVAPEMPWLTGVRMPVAWKRQWGQGRVMYCALGHTLDALDNPTVTTLLSRAVHWALRDSGQPF